MGKYYTHFQREDLPQKQATHPIWRGIGCALIVLTPILAYASTLILLDENTKHGWMQIPNDLIFQGKLPYIGNDPLLITKGILFLLFLFVFSCIFLIISYATNSLFGAPKYGPLDAPEVTFRGKKYKR